MCVCAGKRTSLRNWLSPPTLEVLVVSSGCQACARLSPPPRYSFLNTGFGCPSYTPQWSHCIEWAAFYSYLHLQGKAMACRTDSWDLLVAAVHWHRHFLVRVQCDWEARLWYLTEQALSWHQFTCAAGLLIASLVSAPQLLTQWRNAYLMHAFGR